MSFLIPILSFPLWLLILLAAVAVIAVTAVFRQKGRHR
jgi:hypothetical protein